MHFRLADAGAVVYAPRQGIAGVATTIEQTQGLSVYVSQTPAFDGTGDALLCASGFGPTSLAPTAGLSGSASTAAGSRVFARCPSTLPNASYVSVVFFMPATLPVNLYWRLTEVQVLRGGEALHVCDV